MKIQLIIIIVGLLIITSGFSTSLMQQQTIPVQNAETFTCSNQAECKRKCNEAGGRWVGTPNGSTHGSCYKRRALLENDYAAIGELTTNYVIFFIIIIIYLIAAYLTGVKLTSRQVLFINFLFLFISIVLVNSAYGLAGSVASLGLDGQEHSPIKLLFTKSYFKYIQSIFQILAILGCLKFMLDIRKSKE